MVNLGGGKVKMYLPFPAPRCGSYNVNARRDDQFTVEFKHFQLCLFVLFPCIIWITKLNNFREMLKHGRDTYYSVLYNQVVFKKNTFTSFCKILQNILFQNKIEHLHIDTNKLTFNGNHFQWLWKYTKFIISSYYLCFFIKLSK